MLVVKVFIAKLRQNLRAKRPRDTVVSTGANLSETDRVLKMY